MVFWKEELAELERSNRSFCDVYRIMGNRFSDEQFAQEYIDGVTVRTSYSQLFEGVQSVAHGLSRSFPDSYNSFVGIRMNNSPLWVMSFFGCLMAGFRPVLINTRLDEGSIKYALDTVQAVCTLTDGEVQGEGYINAKDFPKASFTAEKWADEIVLMSSGTTGTPKLVIYDGKAVCEQILVSGWIVKQCPAIKRVRNFQIRLVALLPFYHIFGLSTTLLWFGFFGRTLVFPPGADSQAIQFACKAGGATHFFSIPLVWDTAVKKLLSEAKHQGKENKLRKAIALSNSLQSVFPRFGAFVARNILFKDVRRQVFGNSLVFCISGGGFISDETVEIMNGLGYTLYCGYGMTETGITSVDLLKSAKLRNQNTVGRPFPIIEYKISDTGELLVKGGTLCSGFVTEYGICYRDKDEFFATGDMCSVDKYGRWKLVGRQDDVIIGSGGENISPDMVEKLINVPFSENLCILGLDVNGDTRPVAVIGIGKNTSEYEKLCMATRIYTEIEKLPLTMRPYRVYTTKDEIPSNLGKVKRSLLKDKITNGSVCIEVLDRPAVGDADRVYDESVMKLLTGIKECFARVLSGNAEVIADDAHFIYDLGGDSMSYFNLISIISEEYGKTLRLEKEVPLFTPLDFAREILNTAD